MKTLAGLIWNRFVAFYCRQSVQIQREGMAAIKRKAWIFVGMALAFVPVLLVRLLRPLVLIRFGRLTSERIGHLVHDVEVYLCQRELGLQEKKAWDLFCFGDFVCNAQLAKMSERHLPVFSWVLPMHRVNQLLPWGRAHTVPLNNDGSRSGRDLDNLYGRTKVHIPLTPGEVHFGQLALRKMGVPKDAKYVCFHARDSAYLSSVMPKENWHYHDFRDSRIENYLPAVEGLAERGYYCFRMGAVVKNKIQTHHPMIIDYASRWRTEFLDMYLSATCHFFIASGSGIDSVTGVFRRPIVFVNGIPLEYAPSWDSQFLYIPKKLWLLRERRFLSFREILETGIGRFLESEKYQKHGIEVLENTPDEIADVCLEMDERLRGTWSSTEEDEALQKRFWGLFPQSHLHGRFLSRVGASFLRQNRGLLD